jgi:hypothetical protein
MSREPLVFVAGSSCTAALFGPQLGTLGGTRAVLVADHR